MATGQIIGGILGGLAGGLTTGGAGAQLGWGLGSSIGGMAEGLAKQKTANAMQIDEIDPRQKLLLDEIIQKRKLMESGAYYQPQQDEIKSAGTGAMNRAMSMTGGDVGSGVQALNLINKGTGRNLNTLYSNMMGQSANLLGLENQVSQSIANRSYAIQAYAKQQAMADAETILMNSMQSLQGIMGSETTGNVLSGLFDRIMKNREVVDAGRNLSESAGNTALKLTGNWSDFYTKQTPATYPNIPFNF